MGMGVILVDVLVGVIFACRWTLTVSIGTVANSANPLDTILSMIVLILGEEEGEEEDEGEGEEEDEEEGEDIF
jgi:hypothetical protein